MSDRELRAGASITVASGQTTLPDPRNEGRGVIATLTSGVLLRPSPEVQTEFEAELVFRASAVVPAATVASVTMYVAMDPTWNGRRDDGQNPVKDDGAPLDELEWTEVGAIVDPVTASATLNLPKTIPIRISPRWLKVAFSFTATENIDIFIAPHKERVS